MVALNTTARTEQAPTSQASHTSLSMGDTVMPSASSPSSAKPTAQRDDWTWAESQPLTPAEASQVAAVEAGVGTSERQQSGRTPAVPSWLATAAADHPYSTSFLLGAALTGSCLAGSAAAWFAFRRGALRRGGLQPLRRGSSLCGPKSDSVETRLGRLEAMVRDSQDAQAKLGDQLGQAVPLLLSRLEDIEGSLAKIDAGSLPGSHTGIPAHDLKLDVAQHLLENYQKAGEPLSSDGVGKLPLAEHIESLREDMILLEQNLEATLKAGFESNQAAVREAVQDVGVELDALLSRHAEVTPKELISSVEKSRQSNKAMLVVTSKRLKEVLDRLDHLESDLTVVGGQVSRLGTGADPSIMSVGDIAKEVELLRKNREGSGLSTQSEEAESPQADVDVDPLIETYSAPAVNHSIPTRPLADAETGETSRTAANDKSTDSDSSLNATQGELHFTYPRRKVPAGSRWAKPVTDVEANEAANEPVKESEKRDAPRTEEGVAGANSSEGGSTTEPPPAPTFTHIKSQQPVAHLGVDDSGDWKFFFLPSDQSALRVVSPRVRGLSIRLSRESRRATHKQSPYSISQRMDLSVSTFGPFSTAIIFSSGEVDMVLLDQYWWRCSRDGNTYTVREQVGPDSV